MKDFLQKGSILLFGSIFIVAVSSSTFWWTDLFLNEKHCSVIVFIDLRFVFKK